jgi:hypothetical protein
MATQILTDTCAQPECRRIATTVVANRRYCQYHAEKAQILVNGIDHCQNAPICLKCGHPFKIIQGRVNDDPLYIRDCDC